MFQVPSNIFKITTLADGTTRLTVDCQELPPEEMTEVFRLKGKQGWFVFKDNEIEAIDIPDAPAPEFKNDKSPSKQLRDCLFVYWKKCTNQSTDFNDFWRKWCKKKSDQIKDKLP